MIGMRKSPTPAQALQDRSKAFAFNILRLARRLPYNVESRIVGRQLIRSAMSVAANYRATCRSRSRSEFISKIGVVIEEADESMSWLEALSEVKISNDEALPALLNECDQLISIFVASQRTAKRRAPNRQSAIDNRQSESGT